MVGPPPSRISEVAPLAERKKINISGIAVGNIIAIIPTVQEIPKKVIAVRSTGRVGIPIMDPT